jgi:hypothetical protein
MSGIAESETPAPGFSLVLGGPLFQLFCRTRLCDDAMTLLRQRILVLVGICWLPLLVLSAIEGRLLPGSVPVPFLYDIEAHVRFLVALPLLIAAELMVHQRLGLLVRLFTDRKLIPEADLPRFEAARASAARLRNSVLPELLLIAFVYTVGILVVWRRFLALDGTWYTGPSGVGSELSLAGRWYSYVALPLFQFLLLRWYFRVFIWARFLWQVSRIRLQLVPTHPDRAGGLGFLGATGPAFGLLLLGQGTLVSGQLANRIFFMGAQLTDFKYEALMYIVFVLLAVTLPLAAFVPQLARAKRMGRAEYGNLANRYMREFDSKWVRGRAPAEEPLIGSADIQSLADMGNSYSVVQEMAIYPISRNGLFQLVVLAAAPLLPLVLTIMPLEELLKRLFGILL